MKTHRIQTIVIAIFMMVLQTGLLKAQFAGGAGTAQDPYRIATAVHLDSVRYFLSSHFIQTAHIDLYNYSHSDGNGWMPIAGAGTSGKFSGHYDGNGFIVYNLNINRPLTPDVGLFGHIGDNTLPTSIKNLGLVNVDLKGALGTGSLVGRVTGNKNTLIESCFAANGTVFGDAETGGLIGVNNSHIKTPSKTDNPVIDQCYASVNVLFSGNGTDRQKYGGLAGCNQMGEIRNSYSRGSVTVNSSTTQAKKIGGLAGGSDLRSSIINSYSTGAVITSGTNITLVGGLVGSKEGKGANAGVITDSYWDTQTSGLAISAGGTGKTSLEMKTQAGLIGFNFDTIWVLNSSKNDGYPSLQWEPAYFAADIWQWTGNGFTNWSETAGWNRNALPGENVLVRINPSIGNSAVNTKGQKILDMEIMPGASLIINPDADLTITGKILNGNGENGLIIKSNTNASGSLIHANGEIKGTHERQLNKDKWYMVSAPVSGQKTLDFILKADNKIPVKTETTTYGMMYYSEKEGGWKSYAGTNITEDLLPGQGYMARRAESDGAVSMSGTLNTGNISLNVTKERFGWNALGNPFPSSIGVTDDASTANNFISYNANSFDPNFAALYLWDEPTEKQTGVSYYKVISNSGFTVNNRENINQSYLQPGQGFIVKAKENTSFTFTQEMRIHQHSDNQFYKKSIATSWPGIQLKVSDETRQTSTIITFNREMTKGLDVTYDAGLFGGDPALRLYTKLIEDNGTNFSIQCLPDNAIEPMAVELGVDYKKGGNITFSVEKLVALPYGYGALLEDRMAGEYIDMDDLNATYSTYVAPNTAGTGRFVLHFNNKTTLTKAVKKESLKIYSSGKQIFISGNIPSGSQAILYDLSGRVNSTFYLEDSETNIIQVTDMQSGIYILNVQGKGLNESRKIIL